MDKLLRLAHRLLCACNLAYGITADGNDRAPLTPVPPILPSPSVIDDMLAGSGLHADLYVHQAEDRSGIDAFLYGETDRDIILAFRGTLPVRLATEHGRLLQTLSDWTNNANAVLNDGRPFGLPGCVHAGFSRSLHTLWQADGGLLSILPRIRGATRSGKRLFVTGHSKGGAIACLAALRLAASGDAALRPDAVATFAAPRVGDHDFAAAFDRALADRAWRFEYQNDIVPLLPPSESFWGTLRQTLGSLVPPVDRSSSSISPDAQPAPNRIGAYASAGRLQFIDWQDRLVEQDTPELQAERRIRLVQALITALPEIGRAHLPMRGYGYMDFLSRRL